MKTLNLLHAFVLFLFFLGPVNFAYSQDDCNCDLTFEPGDLYIDGSKYDIQPGDTICLKAGYYRLVNLFNFSGSEEERITFINCGGQVRIGDYGHYYGFAMKNNKHFRLTGTGHPDYKYGILIDGVAGTHGLMIGGQSSDFEIDHIEIANIEVVGFMCKQDPQCDDPGTWEENFVMRNVKIHDLYIHHTGNEGMYVGFSNQQISCGDEIRKPHLIENIEVYNNIFDHTGWEGFQVSKAHKNCKIYNNRVTNYSLENYTYQNCGVTIGGITTGLFFNNYIDRGISKAEGPGISLFGSGENYLYNNVIVNAGMDGIFCDDRTTVEGRGFHFMNNTIISPVRDGIRIYSKQSSGNKFYNNLIVDPGSEGAYNEESKSYIYFAKGVDFDTANNLAVRDIDLIGFKDAAKHDYRLKQGSPAIDKGVNLLDYGIKYDFDWRIRDESIIFDIGAFEFNASQGDMEVIMGRKELSSEQDNALFEVLKIYPNPLNGEENFYIDMQLQKKIPLSIIVWDVAGRILYSDVLDLNAGRQTYVMDSSKFKWKNNNLFILSLISDNVVKSRLLTK